MADTDELLARKLTLTQRDALVTAYRKDRIAARVKVDGDENPEGVESHGHLFDLAQMKLLELFAVSDIDPGTVDHVYGITGRGRRVARHLPQVSGAPLETLYIRVVSDADPDAAGKWVTVENFDIVAMERMESVTDQFYMLRPHIPKGFHPIGMTRTNPGVRSDV